MGAALRLMRYHASVAQGDVGLDSARTVSGWEERPVNRLREYFELRYGEYDERSDEGWNDWIPVALVGPPVDGLVSIELLVPGSDAAAKDLVAAALEEIDYFLVKLGHDDAWGYAQYHAMSTLANFYSTVHWGYRMAELDKRVSDFSGALLEHPQFEKMTFSIKQLRDDSNWPWGHAHGVYCFLVDGEVVYVGRALGCTIGQRLWDQLRSQSDPAWAEVVTREDNQVEVFAVGRDWAFLGAALEVYLIERLHPKFNKQLRVAAEPTPPACSPEAEST